MEINTGQLKAVFERLVQNIDDDGTVGTVTIGAKQRSVVDEARRRIELILDPPTPEVGAVYSGRVVNITKFGAFVNILPGRDGLVHISRLGQGKRVERVEDVVTLGQEVEVRVDEIDPQGKVSLSLAGEPAPTDGGEEPGDGGPRSGNGGGRRQGGRGASETASGGDEPAGQRRRPSFEDAFESELQSTFGDLGPADLAPAPPAGGPRRSSEGGGPRRGSGGGSGAARRRPRSGGR